MFDGFGYNYGAQYGIGGFYMPNESRHSVADSDWDGASIAGGLRERDAIGRKLEVNVGIAGSSYKVELAGHFSSASTFFAATRSEEFSKLSFDPSSRAESGIIVILSEPEIDSHGPKIEACVVCRDLVSVGETVLELLPRFEWALLDRSFDLSLRNEIAKDDLPSTKVFRGEVEKSFGARLTERLWNLVLPPIISTNRAISIYRAPIDQTAGGFSLEQIAKALVSSGLGSR